MSQPSAAAAAHRRPQRGLAAVPEPARPPFDVLESKLRVPPVDAGTVSRTGLVNRLRAERALRLATVVAPAGYGKTTLLAQWATRDERPFVWLTIDEHDNDPVVLLRHLAAALARVEPLDAPVGGGLADEALWREAVPRLVNALAARSRPLVAVLEDADRLRKGDSADVVAALAENVPAGSMLVLSGRVTPRVGIPRLRAARRLLELGPGELALSLRETQLLLRGAGVELDSPAVAELHGSAEGWAAGLYLVARGLADDAGASDRYVDDYFGSELLAGLAPERIAFLRRTSVLDRLCGPLCDAVTGSTRSASELHALERAGLFLFSPGGARAWYRYHGLFRETLRRELVLSEPELEPVLHLRAADWLEAHGEPEAALDHVLACGDPGRAARLLAAVALPAYQAGRAAAVEAWLHRFGATAELARHPQAAAVGAWIHALGGRAGEARAWLEAADPRSEIAALLRVAMCAGTADELAAQAEAALAALPAQSPWRAPAHILLGGVHSMRGDAPSADESFAAAAAAGPADTRAAALGARSLGAASAGDHAASEAFALEARRLLADGPVVGYPPTAIAHAAAARVLQRRGRWDDARHEIASAEPLARRLTEALPWLAVETRLALAAAHLALRDGDRARAELDELDDVVARHSCLDAFRARAAELRGQLEELPTARDGRSSGLTAAELRLLPLLATHLSFREIGERLYVSRNTIKTQAISAYRKLGVSTRSAAIARASELGLVEDATAPPNGFTRPG